MEVRKEEVNKMTCGIYVHKVNMHVTMAQRGSTTLDNRESYLDYVRIEYVFLCLNAYHC